MPNCVKAVLWREARYCISRETANAMKTCVSILIIICCAISGFGQSTLTVKGKVTDIETGEAISNVFVQIVGTPYAANTSKAGFYEIKCTQPIDTFSVSVKAFNHISQTKSGLKGAANAEQKEVVVNFKLQFLAVELPVVDVNSDPDTVWGSKELNVADFAFVPQGLLLLTYEKEDRWKRQEEASVTLYSGCRLILLDKEGKEVTRKLVTEISKDLYTGYFEDAFLRCRKNTYHIHIEDDLIQLFPISESDFEKGIKPVVDTLGTLTYFSNFDENYPAFQYMIFDQRDSTYNSFRYIIDEEMMRMLRSEYKYLDPRGKVEALNFELRTGMDKEVIAAYMRGFQNTHYYEKLNVPLIVSRDTLMIFDHKHDKMIRFDWRGQALDSILISYHKLKKPERWSEQLMKDKESHLIYTYSQKNGYTYVKQIDTRTGNSLPSIKLSNRYVSNIRINDGWAYYIYRPFENSQQRFLYKERI